MTTRLARPDAQIEHLAAELKRRWVAADGVEPWLRRHVPRLTNLVRVEGWTWNDVARALTVAGITYATGRAWSGRQLAVKAAEVRLQLRTQEERRSTKRKWTPIVADAGKVEATMAPKAEPPPSPAESAVPDLNDADPPRRTFGVARPRGWTPPAQPSEPKAPAPAAAPLVDADAVLARFMGRPYPTTPTKGER